MPKTMRSKEETVQYLSGKGNMAAFINGLHDYLEKSVKCSLTEAAEGGRHLNCDSYCLFANGDIKSIHFISFCKNRHLDWKAAEDMLLRIPDRHWYSCDGIYLYSLKVNDDGNAYFVNVNPHIYF